MGGIEHHYDRFIFYHLRLQALLWYRLYGKGNEGSARERTEYKKANGSSKNDTYLIQIKAVSFL